MEGRRRIGEGKIHIFLQKSLAPPVNGKDISARKRQKTQVVYSTALKYKFTLIYLRNKVFRSLEILDYIL